ncbi:hypothetical protein MTX26_18870 [Bradyrhizobium sp. ISRA443]|uniref:hypothetical protein n=1 Tax=unclassified Bradyrhizobium TaxID=2631580 RepID=UPI00247A0AE7|nr:MULTISPECIES: hypothetical protein [unclassified Bradyrhizobium]WGR96533.1 hypothetical protein MTX23_18870 [Bradyrhizobium sp. ISRA436]WGS03420.1 hypothetical protein MTX18_18870 [Bradyrhizobium sp. ISRA437]WGS10304.1 hypothetical protein MTX26_18870 [Bradyrhizobium sp. ISRA443]
MTKIDLDALSIEELASLRDHATEKLYEKVAARQAELEAELSRLSQYAKPVKKAPAAPVAKIRKREEESAPKEQAAKAA